MFKKLQMFMSADGNGSYRKTVDSI